MPEYVNYSAYRMPDAKGLPIFYEVGILRGTEYAPGYVDIRNVGQTYPEGSPTHPAPHSIRTMFWCPDVVDADRIW